MMKKTLLAAVFTLNSLFAGLYEDAEAEYRKASPDQKKPMLKYVIELASKIKSAKDTEKQRLIDIYGVTVATGLMHGLNEKAGQNDVNALKDSAAEVYSTFETRLDLQKHLIATGISMDLAAKGKQDKYLSQFTALSTLASSKAKKGPSHIDDKEWVVNRVLSTLLPWNTSWGKVEPHILDYYDGLETFKRAYVANGKTDKYDDFMGKVNRLTKHVHGNECKSVISIFSKTPYDRIEILAKQFEEIKTSVEQAMEKSKDIEDYGLFPVIDSLSKISSDKRAVIIEKTKKLIRKGMKGSDISSIVTFLSPLSNVEADEFIKQFEEITKNMKEDDFTKVFHLLEKMSVKKRTEIVNLKAKLASVPIPISVISFLLPLTEEEASEFVVQFRDITEKIKDADYNPVFHSMLKASVGKRAIIIKSAKELIKSDMTGDQISRAIDSLSVVPFDKLEKFIEQFKQIMEGLNTKDLCSSVDRLSEVPEAMQLLASMIKLKKEKKRDEVEKSWEGADETEPNQKANDIDKQVKEIKASYTYDIKPLFESLSGISVGERAEITRYIPPLMTLVNDSENLTGKEIKLFISILSEIPFEKRTAFIEKAKKEITPVVMAKKDFDLEEALEAIAKSFK